MDRPSRVAPEEVVAGSSSLLTNLGVEGPAARSSVVQEERSEHRGELKASLRSSLLS